MTQLSGITEREIDFALRLAEAARATLTAGAGQSLGVEVKPDRSFVTRMDRAIEERLRALIEAEYPAHGIIGEETGTSGEGASHSWVIDPIDGTAPFITGIPVSGTLIALAVDGVPVLGIIDVPAVDQRWLGVVGRPTTLNGRPCRSRDCPALAQAVLLNSNQDYLSAAEMPALEALRKLTAHRVYGGACLGYGRLAEGRCDLAIDAGQQVFDFAPFRPVIEGAGGVVTDWAGRPLTLESDGRLLASGGRACHEAALAVIAELGIPPA